MYGRFYFGNVIYFTSKECLKEEANKMISDEKNEFFAKTVSVTGAASDAADKMLRKKFGKMNKADLKEFKTLQVSINKDKAHSNAPN